MKNDMKIIMENWRRNTLNEQEAQLMTVGDLKAALLGALQAKKQGIAAGELKNTATGLLLDLIPGAGTAKNIADILVNVYKLPDEKRTNTGLDSLNVNDQVSAVLDDRVENQFIKDYLTKFDKVPDDVKLGNIDMTQLLSDFIKEKYEQTKVEKGQ